MRARGLLGPSFSFSLSLSLSESFSLPVSLSFSFDLPLPFPFSLFLSPSSSLLPQIYIAPFELHDDVHSYYLKLLEVGGVSNAVGRVKIMTPENFHRFPEHFSLKT